MTKTATNRPELMLDDDKSGVRPRISKLPADYRVVSEADAAAYCGLSLVHFRRMRRDKMGPKHVRLTEKRVGYRFRDLLVWIEDRIS